MCLPFTMSFAEVSVFTRFTRQVKMEHGKLDSPFNTNIHTRCRLSKQVSVYFRSKLSQLYCTHTFFSYSAIHTNFPLHSFNINNTAGGGERKLRCRVRSEMAEWRVGVPIEKNGAWRPAASVGVRVQ